MAKRPFVNRLNELSPKEWLLFQKSWFIHNPPPRNREVLRHPAKFPETLAQEFIEFFSRRNQIVFDPMAGTGSTLIAALRSGRQSYGIEINPIYVEITQQRIEDERTNSPELANLAAKIHQGNALFVDEIINTYDIPEIDYLLTSPPYWDMLHAKGALTQKHRRSSGDLDVVYSDNPEDLGNIQDYAEFLDKLVIIYQRIQPYMRVGAYMTIIVKNIKKGGRIYPLAWDLASRLSLIYSLKDEKIWLQDNQRLAPYGLGNAWVSNTFHHYCLQFRNDLN
jgi:DNA modification methylase